MRDPIKADTRAAEFQYNNVTTPCRKCIPPRVSLALANEPAINSETRFIGRESRCSDRWVITTRRFIQKSHLVASVGELARCGHCVRSRIDPHFSSARGLRNKSAYACANAIPIPIAKSRVSYARFQTNAAKAVSTNEWTLVMYHTIDQMIMIRIAKHQMWRNHRSHEKRKKNLMKEFQDK